MVAKRIKLLFSCTAIFLLVAFSQGCREYFDKNVGKSSAQASLISITISPPDAVVTEETELQYTAAGKYSDNSEKDITSQAAWNSSDHTAAAVTGAGLVKAVTPVKSGIVELTATLDGIVGRVSVTVINLAAPQFISIAPTCAVITSANDRQFSATGRYSNNLEKDITSRVAWLASDETVAAVTDVGLASAASPAKTGAIEIIAALGGVEARADLTVTGTEPPQSISITPAFQSLPYGTGIQFKAEGTFSNGGKQDLTSLVRWLSSDPTITFTDAGLAQSTATSAATATISARFACVEGTTILKSAASSIKLANTGQKTCFDSEHNEIPCTNTGQDGDWQKGADWPDTRFTVNDEASITDNLSGLEWTRSGNLMLGRDPDWDTDYLANDGGVTWQHALDYVAKLNSEKHLGYDDWRLPNINELQSLLNFGEASPLEWLKTQGFTDLYKYKYYWSSTTVAEDAGKAWIENINLDRISGESEVMYLNNKVLSYNLVWPVRTSRISALAPAAVPRTGQQRCYDNDGQEISCANTGQDGDLKEGAIWPNPRFSANSEASIKDNLTGLVWAPNGNLVPARNPGWDTDGLDDGGVSWQHALDYVAKLNSENYLGHNDWRLPNINELKSLLHFHYGRVKNSDWLNTQGFTAVEGRCYLSSTTNMAFSESTGCTWFISLSTPSPLIESILGCTSKYYISCRVWPVRGGE